MAVILDLPVTEQANIEPIADVETLQQPKTFAIIDGKQVFGTLDELDKIVAPEFIYEPLNEQGTAYRSLGKAFEPGDVILDDEGNFQIVVKNYVEVSFLEINGSQQLKDGKTIFISRNLPIILDDKECIKVLTKWKSSEFFISNNVHNEKKPHFALNSKVSFKRNGKIIYGFIKDKSQLTKSVYINGSLKTLTKIVPVVEFMQDKRLVREIIEEFELVKKLTIEINRLNIPLGNKILINGKEATVINKTTVQVKFENRIVRLIEVPVVKFRGQIGHKIITGDYQIIQQTNLEA